MKLKQIGKITNIKRITAPNGLKMIKFKTECGVNLMLPKRSFEELKIK